MIYQIDIRKSLQVEDSKAFPLRTDSSASLISKFQDSVMSIEASEAVIAKLYDSLGKACRKEVKNIQGANE